MTSTLNADPAELAKFSELAHRWWDMNSEFRPLHEINPLRLGWIESLCSIKERQALDVGCVAYCHAFSDASTLKQVKDVVEAGQVWIGKSLMQRLLHGINRLVPKSPTPDAAWRDGLTPREIEIAILAANGASNQAIAAQCAISERTVKAHLSAVFGKLIITDRLQLALRVHGIQ